jgi:hypothetical protein
MSLCNNHFDVKGNTAHSSGELNLICLCNPNQQESLTSAEAKGVRLSFYAKNQKVSESFSKN